MFDLYESAIVSVFITHYSLTNGVGVVTFLQTSTNITIGLEKLITEGDSFS